MTNDHIKQILDMVSSKDITVEDATKLLGAISEDKGYTVTYPHFHDYLPIDRRPLWGKITTSGDLVTSGTLMVSK